MPDLLKGKKSLCDLKVKDDRNNIYIIEMQKRNEKDYLQRIQYYASHAITDQLEQGTDHTELNPVITISIMGRKCFGDDIPCISYHPFKETTTGKQILLTQSHIFIELPKLENSGLTGSTNYSYKVTVYDLAGNSATTSTISASTLAGSGGGGGGGGGACLWIGAKSMQIDGRITVEGGRGGDATGNAGGGGGGGGGVVWYVTQALTGSGTITAAGGAPGASAGTASAASSGSNGVVVPLVG
jgi:hypothetical protein